MVEIRVVVACAECRTHWDATAEEPRCNDVEHHHRRFEVHRHLSSVPLPDGTSVTAASFNPLDPYARVARPDYGLYFDRRWQPPWPHGYVDWPDFGVPADPAPVLTALRDLLERVGGGQRVEVGCLGGHGRTGTALAGLAVLTGHPVEDAVAWVRAHYCADAMETAEQETFVATLAP